MRLPIYQVDAFADAVFKGNPAAVMPLESWLPDDVMQKIAGENNLSETAFFVAQKGGLNEDGFALRWFTPANEVKLCGHATLASAWVIFNRLEPARRRIDFFTKSGTLTVRQDGETGRLSMDFPAQPASDCMPCAGLIEALGATPAKVMGSTKYMLVYETAEQVRKMKPDMGGLMNLDRDGVIVTAPSDLPGVDCVSRYFVPAAGIPEDPVTGSAHCIIVPYWAKRLGKQDIVAYQASARGGRLYCRDEGERVRMAGMAVPFMEGVVTL